jgi:hypothetical protein
MKNLPNHILNALSAKQTSLGHCPAFPEYEDRDFSVELLTDRYNQLLSLIGSDNSNLLKRELKRLLRECKQIESECKGALEKLCVSVVTDIFNIPQGALNIHAALVDKVDSGSQRMIPEDSVDFTFDNIEDMRNLTGEVHKRRLLNALITGASITIAGHISKYAGELFDINPDLPSMYKRIMAYNEMLSFVEEDSITTEDQASDGGKVDVSLGDPNSAVRIEAEGVIFPILLEETIRGILELAISHGLPKEKEKAMYVVGKSDFKLAELWDMRFGIPLWEMINAQLKDDVESNFLLMELSKLPVNAFNNSMAEIFAKTKEGQETLEDIISDIKRSKEKDEFDDFMSIQQKRHQMDDEFFTPDELITDDLD